LFRVCFLSAVYATQAVLPRLTDGGRLVYFGSPLVTEPMPGLGCYAASKAALLSWMRALAHEVKHDGVHANAVVFPMADSPRARRERPHVDFDQAVTPELVARVVGFLTSDAADGLYGSLVPVLGKFGFTTPLAGGPPPGVTKGRGATPKRPVAVPEAAR
jgi:3-oxoacyl-[acyl-carrier protein] reductase